MVSVQINLTKESPKVPRIVKRVSILWKQDDGDLVEVHQSSRPGGGGRTLKDINHQGSLKQPIAWMTTLNGVLLLSLIPQAQFYNPS